MATPTRGPEGSSKEIFWDAAQTVIALDPTGGQSLLLAALLEVIEVLREVRDECRATRLAVQDLVNEGNLQKTDYLDAANAVRDAQEES